jgi:hypothetical protein
MAKVLALISLPPQLGNVRRRPLLLAFGIATVAFWAVLYVIDERLKGTGGPSILGLEFAGSAEQVDRLAAEWGAHGVYLARLSLWIDFGFMVSYGAFFTLAGLATRDFARTHGRSMLAATGLVVPYFGIGAAVFDVFENTIWLLALGDHATSLAPVATGCAIVKFVLITVAEVYALCGLLAWVWSLRRGGSR